MKQLLKILVIVYFAMVFPLLFVIADFFILETNPKIYNFIPQEADVVIEINTKNFIKEIAYQRIFNETYFLEKIPPTEEDESLIKNIDFGINPASPVIFFREQWADQNHWYVILEVTNQNKLTTFLFENNYELEYAIADNYCIMLLENTPNNDLIEHLKLIASSKLKPFIAKTNITKIFSNQYEMNIYLSPKQSKHIIDGYLHLNFTSNKVIFNGNLTPVGVVDQIPYTKYQLNPEKAFSLRSSLNIFKSIYLLENNISITNLPEYKQLALDYNGSKLISSHNSNPLTAYPDINLKFDIEDSVLWHNYLTDFNQQNGVEVDTVNHTIYIYTKSKSVINYELTRDYLKLYQMPFDFVESPIENTYFEMNINPNLLVENTIFEKDTLNPPSFTDNLKISIIQSLIEDMNFFINVDHVNFSIKRHAKEQLFVCNGVILYKNKNGHALIESMVLFKRFSGSVGSFIE
jgi:hypothetical protein